MASHGGTNKIKTILIWLFVCIVIGLFVYWLVTGGAHRAWEAGKNFSNPIAIIFGNGTTTGTFIRLPWQPEMTRGPDISDYVGAADAQKSAADAQSSTETGGTVTRLREYGTPSPYVGAVIISGNNASAGNPADEYVQIQASSDGASPINITGWSLQSVVSGIYALIPPATSVFIGGVVNTLQPVRLAPGALATLTTGVSPVGVSLQETRCTGYLSQSQHFSPDLSDSCPEPTDALPQTTQNLKVYGASCFDYIANIPACYFSGSTLPPSLTPECRSFIANNLSYNGCVAMYRDRQNFGLPSWRLYLGHPREFWNNSHDIIRLLDGEGRVVDVLSY